MAVTTIGARAKRLAAPAQPGLFGIRTWTKTRLAIAIVMAVISIFPLLYMVSLAFQPVGEILGATPHLIPAHPTVQNFVQAWTENSFGRYFLNSVVVSLSTVVLTDVIAALAAFAFARYKFPLKEAIFYFLLASLAIPGIGIIIAQYLLMDRLHLLDSLFGLIVLYVASNLPFTIFLLRGFFASIPKEYEEAFRLEGASTLRVLTSLIVPLSLPAIAVVSMFTFNAAWDEFVLALTMLNSNAHYTLPIGLSLFIGEHTTAWGAFFAACVIATIPNVVIFLVTQRWFRRGVSLGGLR